MKQLCLLSPWTSDCKVCYFKVSLCFWQTLGQVLWSFTQQVAKGLWNLVWGEHFHILMNSETCWQFLLQSDMFMSMFPVPSPTQSNWISVWRSVSSSICSVSHWIFSPWKAVQFWAHFDKTLVFRFLTKYLWGLSPARANGLVLVQERDRPAANVWQYFVFQCRLCYTPVLEEYLLSFSFAVHSSGMEPHFHCLKLMLTDSLWAFDFFFLNDKKERRKLTDEPAWKDCGS